MIKEQIEFYEQIRLKARRYINQLDRLVEFVIMESTEEDVPAIERRLIELHNKADQLYNLIRPVCPN